MSALPPKADIAERDHHVRFVPKADISTAKLAGEKVATPAYRRPGKIVARASNWLASIIKRIAYRLR